MSEFFNIYKYQNKIIIINFLLMTTKTGFWLLEATASNNKKRGLFLTNMFPAV